MNTPQNIGIFSPNEKEKAGIASLFRGFLTKQDGKRACLARDVNQSLVPLRSRPLPRTVFKSREASPSFLRNR
ncbi:MAG: hypothetical protein EOM42_04045 [Negativicutes bacterium]|nr:hypothetical protein [Negativicutes bacterium]